MTASSMQVVGLWDNKRRRKADARPAREQNAALRSGAS